ncbi:DUF2188 domain-containing protein [Baekduia soli]|uniref:DUF2188 domain-containing protein n=1 Tax=Baekduia soli TaxID=496014 RepID=UPI001652783D
MDATRQSEGGWAVQHEVQDQPVFTHSTQAEAEQAARSRATRMAIWKSSIHRPTDGSATATRWIRARERRARHRPLKRVLPAARARI